MPLFALPLTSSSMTRFSKSKTSRVKFTSLPVRKRKRSHSSPQSSDDDENFSTDEQSGVAASTNPFSLTPAEIAQYRLAGLELNEKLPDVKAFPHRGLPRTAGSHDTSAKGKASRRRSRLNDDDEEDIWPELKEEEEDKDAVERPSRGPWLKNQHLSVLTTILHRCLQEGDIKRASRAWAMLLRVQISGKEIDVRSNGYWQIGAALLMRSLDKKKKYSYDDAESDAEDFAEQVKGEGRESRWGTKEGLEQASEYYHRMILQFPHRKFFRGHATAVDFWPAMVSCELYGIQYEYEDGLRRVEKQEAIDDEEDGSGDDSQESRDESLESEVREEDPEDDSFTINQRRKERTQRKRAEKRWAEREDVRKAALAASKVVAAKFDQLVDDLLYLTSHNILRLRGMLALYIGDLSVPAMPLPYDDEDQNGNSLRRSGRRGGLVESSERRLQFRERVAEHDRGKKKQADERDRAAKLFDKISGNSGEDEDVQHLDLETVRKERQK